MMLWQIYEWSLYESIYKLFYLANDPKPNLSSIYGLTSSLGTWFNSVSNLLLRTSRLVYIFSDTVSTTSSFFTFWQGRCFTSTSCHWLRACAYPPSSAHRPSPPRWSRPQGRGKGDPRAVTELARIGRDYEDS